MSNGLPEDANRRAFFKQAGILVTGTAIVSPLLYFTQAGAEEERQTKDKAEVSPPEDLMREHGVLRRILLIYENIRGMLISDQAVPAEALSASADLIRKFIENYHEKLEEDFLFPRFKNAGKLVDLVTVLLDQHHAGRRLTEFIQKSASPAALKEAPKRKALAERLHLFLRMYRPHAAREDTILFPGLRTIVSEKEFNELGEQFEEKEDKLFGEGGFEKIVAQVAELEKGLGIYELSQFTPPR